MCSECCERGIPPQKPPGPQHALSRRDDVNHVGVCERPIHGERRAEPRGEGPPLLRGEALPRPIVRLQRRVVPEVEGGVVVAVEGEAALHRVNDDILLGDLPPLFVDNVFSISATRWQP